jgi:hypothetical protein
MPQLLCSGAAAADQRDLRPLCSNAFEGAAQAMDFAMGAAHRGHRITAAYQRRQARIKARIVFGFMGQQARLEQSVQGLQCLAQGADGEYLAVLGQPQQAIQYRQQRGMLLLSAPDRPLAAAAQDFLLQVSTRSALR